MAAGVLKSLGELTFQISPDLSKFGEQLTSGMGLVVGSTVGTIGQIFESLGKAMLKKFTLPLAIGAAANIAQFQALDREIRSTITLLGTAPSVVDSVFDGFSASIARVSTDVGGLERDIADGLYQAISAGVPRGDIGDFLNIAQMAAIADKTADMETAVDGLTTVMNAFSSEGLTFDQIADIMFATVAKGKTTMGELSQSIGRAAGIANNAGVEFAEFQAVIGAMTLGGFKTAEAVSFLRAAITGLLRPGEEMNAVFQAIGFSTAEAAIPIIGLQPAFQAVVDAAGGSTSKLQELIGTSEGVSAILGVTGANAEKFAGVLDATTNAAGFLVNAFEIAEGGIGRSFGRMTEAFDRLGNRLGAIASEIARPFVDVVTDIVNRVIGALKKMMPVIDTIIDGFKGLAKVFDIPGVKALTAGLIAMGLVFGSLLGVMAPVILALGVLLKTFIILRSVIIVTQAWAAANAILAAGLRPIIAGFQRLLAMLAGVFPRAVSASTKSMVGFTAAAQKATLALSPLGLLGVIVLITAAIAIAVIAYRKYKDSMARLREEAFITSKGIDVLADSMNIALKPVSDLFDAVGGELTTEFVLKNQGTLRRIEETQLRLGNAAARDYVLGIALQFQKRGATPREVADLIANLEAATEQTFNIKFGIISDDAAFAQVQAQIDLLLRDIAEKSGLKDSLTVGLQIDLTAIAEGLTNIYATQGPEAYLEAQNKVAEELKKFPVLTDFLADEVLKSFERLEGQEFGFEGIGAFQELTTLDDVIRLVTERIVGFWNPIIDDADVAEGAVDAMSSSLGRVATRMARLRAETFLDDDAIATVEKLGDALGDAFDTAKADINAAFDLIERRSLDTVPFLDVFEVSDIDYWDIIQGDHLYDDVLPRITELKERFIADATPEGVEFFDKFLAATVGEQAALALLPQDQLDKLVFHTLANIRTAFEESDTEKAFSAETILGPIGAALDEELQAVVTAAEEAGTAISNAVDEKLAEGGAEWVETVRLWMIKTGEALTSTQFGGNLALGGPSIIATITVYNNEVNVSGSQSRDPGVDVRRALQSVGGSFGPK